VAVRQRHDSGQKGRVRVRATAERRGQRLGEQDALALDHQVDVLVRAAEQQVPDHAADQEGGAAQLVRHPPGRRE
jgi:hypothetical protein